MAVDVSVEPVVTYATEAAKARRDVLALADIARRNPRDPEKRVRLAYRRYHLASLTRDSAEFSTLVQEIAALLVDFGPQEDICLIKANVAGRFHRIAEMQEILALCPTLAARPAGRVLAADIDFQQGRYDACHEKLLDLSQSHPSWDVLAHLAHWTSKFGDPVAADRVYAAAGRELSAKEMRSYAWLELQRAELWLARGRLPQAEVHARRAERAFPGAPKHFDLRAKLLAAAGDLEAACVVLRAEAEFAPRPELSQAIGELLVALGRDEEATPWSEAALAGYLASDARGEVHYWHHLADFYASPGRDSAQAVRWASADLRLRENFTTQTALAWALLQNGGIQDGIVWIERALASDVRDPGVAHVAARLYEAAGDLASSRLAAARAAEICPLQAVVHLHL